MNTRLRQITAALVTGLIISGTYGCAGAPRGGGGGTPRTSPGSVGNTNTPTVPNGNQIRTPDVTGAAVTPFTGDRGAGGVTPANAPTFETGRAISAFIASMEGIGGGTRPMAAGATTTQPGTDRPVGVSTLVVGELAFVGIDATTLRPRTGAAGAGGGGTAGAAGAGGGGTAGAAGAGGGGTAGATGAGGGGTAGATGAGGGGTAGATGAGGGGTAGAAGAGGGGGGVAGTTGGGGGTAGATGAGGGGTAGHGTLAGPGGAMNLRHDLTQGAYDMTDYGAGTATLLGNTGLVDAIRSRVRTSFPQVDEVYVTTDPTMVWRIARVTGDAFDGETSTRRVEEMFAIAREMAATGPARATDTTAPPVADAAGRR